MFKKEIINKNSLNIFTKDIECELIHKFSIYKYKCKFYRNSQTNNIIKELFDNITYNNEINIYLYLLDKQITLLSTPDKLALCYNIKYEISLHSYLDKYKPNISFLLNELFSFVNKFKSYKFLHGNLHIHNIFLNPNLFLRKSTFYVIDFSNSYILNNSYSKNRLFVYNWDFFSLYISLKNFFKNDIKNLIYLENLILTYINPSDLRSLLNKYTECSI
jgi:hypothetical protein